jgi:hypothetical protein
VGGGGQGLDFAVKDEDIEEGGDVGFFKDGGGNVGFADPGDDLSCGWIGRSMGWREEGGWRNGFRFCWEGL